MAALKQQKKVIRIQLIRNAMKKKYYCVYLNKLQSLAVLQEVASCVH